MIKQNKKMIILTSIVTLLPIVIWITFMESTTTINGYTF